MYPSIFSVCHTYCLYYFIDLFCVFFFFFQAEDGIRDDLVTGVQTCALPIYLAKPFKAHELFAVVEGRGADGAEPPAAAPAPVDVAGFRRTMEEAGAAEAVDGILATFVQTLPQRLGALATPTGAGAAEPIRRA